MIFAEVVTAVPDYRRFVDTTNAPVLANMTEFGVSPLATVEELASAGVSLVLYPLSAFRAMSAAARNVFTTIRRDGTQQVDIPQMQTRSELYDLLGYHAYEQKIDELFWEQATGNR